ncbi:MAG: serine hydrolase, partial [Spirochaetota bacterium]
MLIRRYKRFLLGLGFFVSAITAIFSQQDLYARECKHTYDKSDIRKIQEIMQRPHQKSKASRTGYQVSVCEKMVAHWEDTKYRKACKYALNGTCLHYVYSVTKSVTSAVMGIAIKENINGIQDKSPKQEFQKIVTLNLGNVAQEYFKNKEVKDQQKKKAITLHQLLTMTAGFKWKENSRDAPRWTYNLKEDKFTQFTKIRMKAKNQNRFNYSTASADLLSLAVVSKLKCGYGTIQKRVYSLRSIARKFLFEKMNIYSGIQWEADRMCKYKKETYMGGTGLYMNHYAIRKFAELVMNGGRYRGKELIPKQWLQLSLGKSELLYPSGREVNKWVRELAPQNNIHKRYKKEDINLGYGYQWWIVKDSRDKVLYYAAIGVYGQFLAIVPEYSLVVTTTHASSNTLMEYALRDIGKGRKWKKYMNPFGLFPYFHDRVLQMIAILEQVGVVIGRNGATINRIQTASSTR